MKTILRLAVKPVLRSGVTALALALPAAVQAQEAAKSPWTPTVSMEVRGSYDGNVLLQDHGDQARRHSWVSVVLPGISATFQESPAFKAAFSYGAEIAGYHALPSENYVTQRFAANFSGKSGGTAWEFLNGAVLIDGDKYGPTYTGGGTVPALGGIPVRDRRDARIFRNGLKATHSIGRAFVRPMVSVYVHDFWTAQLAAAVRPGYENYVDRREFSGGFDVGYEAFPKTRLFAGYRLGRQEQSPLLGAWSPYSSNYQRPVVGAEGSPAGWLKFSAAGGPDYRTFSPGTASGFKRRPTLINYDASVTLTPTASDTVTLASRRFAQPAFSSHSVYEDVTHDFSYKRKLCGHATFGAGFKVYAGLWLQPTQRRDYIYTPSASLTLNLRKGLTADLGYTRDIASSRVVNTANRTYRRHLVSLGVKYSL